MKIECRYCGWKGVDLRIGGWFVTLHNARVHSRQRGVFDRAVFPLERRIRRMQLSVSIEVDHESLGALLRS
jgi:hypothetical protein